MRERILHVGVHFDLPLDAVTQKLAWLGRTGSGKTFACKKMVEQMLHAHAQVVILDGAGVWAGLRLGSERFDIPVLGGLYGDIPLESTAGALVADVIVDRRTSMVLDVSQMIDAERTRFATAFAGRFFQRKKSTPSAVHLVLEECQEIVPENPQHGEERMLHEFQRLAKQGRSHGIGVSFISQRPQEISKKALNQAECVFAFQMTGPHERKALQYWLSDKGFEGKLADILPTLEVGAPHVWSPQWLKVSKIVRILPIETLDTSRTPKVGEKAFAQKKLEPINLKELTAAMKETVERAKADDPKVLKARILELEKELTKKHQPVAAAQKLGEFEVVVDRRHLQEVIDSTKNLEERIESFTKGPLHELTITLNVVDAAVRRARQTGPAALGKRLAKAPKLPVGATGPTDGLGNTSSAGPTGRSGKHRSTRNPPEPGTILPKGERIILTAVAQHDEGVTPEQLTQLTGYKRSSRDAYLSRLISAGHLERQGSTIHATRDGVDALGPDFEPLPTGRALLEHWIARLPEGERRILEFVASCYPHAVERSRIDEHTEYKRSSRDAYLSRLHARRLVKTEDGGEKLADTLAG